MATWLELEVAVMRVSAITEPVLRVEVHKVDDQRATRHMVATRTSVVNAPHMASDGDLSAWTLDLAEQMLTILRTAHEHRHNVVYPVTANRT